MVESGPTPPLKCEGAEIPDITALRIKLALNEWSEFSAAVRPNLVRPEAMNVPLQRYRAGSYQMSVECPLWVRGRPQPLIFEFGGKQALPLV